MSIYFTSVNYVQTTDYSFPTRIRWVPDIANSNPPDEIQKLCRDIENTLRSLHWLYLQATYNEQQFRADFDELFRIAILGLRGADASKGPQSGEISEAKEHLIALQSSVINEGRKRQSDVGKILLRVGLKIFIPCAIVASAIDIFWRFGLTHSLVERFSPAELTTAKSFIATLPSDTDANRHLIERLKDLIESGTKADATYWSIAVAILASLFWIPAGAVFGNFIVHVAKITDNTIGGFATAGDLQWHPVRAHLYTIIFAYGLLVILSFGILQLGLFGVLLNDFLTKEPAISFVTGMATAIGFTAVRDILLSLKISRRD